MPHLLKKVQKVWWKLLKSIISRAQKRWTHQGSVQLKEPMSQHLPPTSVPKSNAMDGMDEIYENPLVPDLGIVQTLGKGSTQRTNVANPSSYLTSKKKLKIPCRI